MAEQGRPPRDREQQIAEQGYVDAAEHAAHEAQKLRTTANGAPPMALPEVPAAVGRRRSAVAPSAADEGDK